MASRFDGGTINTSHEIVIHIFIGLRENMPELFDFDENFVLQLIHYLVTEFVTCFAAKLHVVNQCNLMLFRSLYFDARENYLKWF